MVRMVTADVPAALVRQAWPETVVSAHPDDPDWDLPGSVGRVQAWTAGPGMGTDAGRWPGWPPSSGPTSRCWWTPTA